MRRALRCTADHADAEAAAGGSTAPPQQNPQEAVDRPACVQVTRLERRHARDAGRLHDGLFGFEFRTGGGAGVSPGGAGSSYSPAPSTNQPQWPTATRAHVRWWGRPHPDPVVVHVQLQEDQVGVLFRQLSRQGGDRQAGAAPGREEIRDDLRGGGRGGSDAAGAGQRRSNPSLGEGARARTLAAHRRRAATHHLVSRGSERLLPLLHRVNVLDGHVDSGFGSAF